MLLKIILTFVSLSIVNSLLIPESEVVKNARMLGGGNSAIIPSVVSIQTFTVHGSFHICGGFIINERWIGTAAQCVINNQTKNTVVSIGTNTIAATQLMHLSRIIRHPNFNEESLVNDIALLETSENIVFSTNIAALPLEETFIDIARTATIAGWGRTAPSSALSQNLLSAGFAVVPMKQCRETFPFVFRRLVPEETICTSQAARALCQGDAGGPVIVNNMIVGIASWVEPCLAGQTNVHTRISTHIEWIKNVTSDTAIVPPVTTPVIKFNG